MGDTAPSKSNAWYNSHAINEVFHNERLSFPTPIIATTSMMILASFIRHRGMIAILPFDIVFRKDRLRPPSIKTSLGQLKSEADTRLQRTIRWSDISYLIDK